MDFTLTLDVALMTSVFFFIAGFIDSIAGGGGLITVPALMLTGLPAHAVLGTNKLASTLGALSTMAFFWKNRCIVMRIAAVGFATAFVGSIAGSWLALRIDNALLGHIMVFLLPVGLAFSLLGGRLRDNATQLPERYIALKAAFIGLTVGLYDGFFGPGAGSFYLIALHVLLGISLVESSATAKVYNLASDLGAFLAFAAGGTVLYELALPCAVMSILGNLLGARCAVRLGPAIVRPILYGVLSHDDSKNYVTWGQAARHGWLVS